MIGSYLVLITSQKWGVELFTEYAAEQAVLFGGSRGKNCRVLTGNEIIGLPTFG